MLLQDFVEAVHPVCVTGDLMTRVTGVAYNSRMVHAGDVFVAVVGVHVDGQSFVDDAIARGAAAIVVDRPLDHAVGVPTLQVANSRFALAQIATAQCGNPAEKLWLAGITGTDGKTTTTELTAQLLEQVGIATGFMSTVTLRTGGDSEPNATRQTTLEAVEIQEGLAAMLAAGRRHAILEVTSHALALHRVEGCTFDVAGVTNVTHDHLEFHGTWDQYVRAKGHLFELLGASPEKRATAAAILNLDDRSYEPLRPFVPAHVRPLTYGLHASADVRAEDLSLSARGSTFRLATPWGSQHVELGLVGQFNVYNALLSAALALVCGVDIGHVAGGLATVRPVAGRMEQIEAGQPFQIVVDYAHTPDSLAKVLTILRQAAGSGRLLAVFGSAGERDVEKRPVMGKIAAELADFSIFTTEDPRFEDPMAIIDQIAVGAIARGKRSGDDFLKIEDRRAAVAAAIDRARPGDVVLLAGKGHEQCIIVGNTKVPWDDRLVAADLARARYS